MIASRLVLVLASASLLRAEPVIYELRPGPANRLTLTVEKTGLMSGRKHRFEFERYRGTLVYDPESPERSRVEFVAEGNSAVCKDTWVSEKDRRKIQNFALHDMMAVERYPELRFSSTGISRKGEDSFEVPGLLTIRGISKPATVVVDVKTQSGRLTSLAGQAVLRMKDYGLKPPGALLGAIGTKNEMTVDFLLVPSTPAEITQTTKPEAEGAR